MIHGFVELSVGTCRLKVLGLNRAWREMSPAYRRLFRRGWASSDSADASVITHIVHRHVIHDDGLVIHVRNVPHVVYGSVVEEDSAIPISSFVADTFVAKTIDNAPVESNIRPPVTLVKNEHAIAPATIARRPEETRFGHPKVSEVAVRPVSGCPDVAFAGAEGLLVHRQRWRGDGN